MHRLPYLFGTFDQISRFWSQPKVAYTGTPEGYQSITRACIHPAESLLPGLPDWVYLNTAGDRFAFFPSHADDARELEMKFVEIRNIMIPLTRKI